MLNEFIELDVNMDTMIQNVKLTKLIATAFLNAQTSKIILIKYKCLFCNKSCQKTRTKKAKKKNDENLKEYFFNTFKILKSILTMILVCLFYYCLLKRVYPYQYINDLKKFSENLII